MATGDKKVNIYIRRHLPLEMLSTYMYSYTRKLILDIMHAVYPESGVFTSVTFSGTPTVEDAVNVTTVNGVDSNGHLVNLSAQSHILF